MDQSVPGGNLQAGFPEIIGKEVIFIDGDCILCNRFAGFVIRHDRKQHFWFAPLDSAPGKELLQQAPGANDDGGSVLLWQGGQVFVRSNAVLRILGRLHFPICLLGWLRILPAFLCDWGYRLVARNRFRLFGRTESCAILSAKEKERFLENIEGKPG